MEDSIGLEEFFAANQEIYQWKERMSAVIISSEKGKIDSELLIEISQIVKNTGNNLVTDSLKAYSSRKGLIFEEGIFEKGTNSVIDGTDWTPGVHLVDGSSLSNIVIAMERMPAGPKRINEIRGNVIADYQDYLDKEWIEELRTKHPVIVNEQSLEKIIDQFE